MELGLLLLLTKRKIDYKSLSEMYVNALEIWNEDEKNKLTEAQQCVLEHIINHKSKKTIQRSLYLLNESKAFQMKEFNEKYSYNEEEAKKLSWYERNKDERL